MLLRFRLEKFKDFVWYFFVERQRVEIRARRCGDHGFTWLLRSEPVTWLWLGKVQRRGFRGEREAIAFLEKGNIVDIFFARVADFQQIRFQQRNSIRKKFRQRAVQIAAQRRVQRILKNVSKFPCNFRESRESITRRRAA